MILCTWGCLSNLSLGHASADQDRQFDLSTIGALKSWDNVDGLFSDYIAQAYKEYFAHENRFIYNDLSRADYFMEHSNLPYSKIIQDADILGQLARTTRTESLLRTKAVKTQTGYTFDIDWLHSPKMEVIGQVHFTLDSTQGHTVDQAQDLDSPEANSSSGTSAEALIMDGPVSRDVPGSFEASDLIQLFEIHLSRLFASTPILASITGRDGAAITVSLGSHSRIRPGDRLQIETLDRVRVHPLTGAIVDWQFTPTGQVEVEQVEDGMAFCQVILEYPGMRVSRSQKVTHIISSQNSLDQANHQTSVHSQHDTQLPFEPKLGWVGAGLLVGPQSWQFSDSSVTQTGGGFAFLGKANGQLWLTREWFFEGSGTYGFWSFTQQNATTGTSTAVSQNGGVSASFISFKGELGYAFLMGAGLRSPKGWVKAGYRTTSYSMPISASEQTGPIGLSSVMVGIGGELPVAQNWGILANLSFRVLSFASATWVSSPIGNTSDVDFFIGAYHKLTPRISLKAGLDLYFTGLEFTNGATISQKTITFGPSLLYYL